MQSCGFSNLNLFLFAVRGSVPVDVVALAP